MGVRSKQAQWGFGEGDAISEGLTALRLLGGGSNYEAYLAFDDVTWLPVVVKVLRPDQVDDEGALDGLRREAQALRRINHPVVVRGLRHEEAGSARTSCSSRSTGRDCRRWCVATVRCRPRNTCRWPSTWLLRSTTSAASVGCTST
ncbi:hypothetical protein [Nocardioides alcanivorans]|uniref:hypothetical protein n=1 Tax=Nocardioides alcanivorans TaxID=2897352 RepID=UPI001F47D40D|nr:hypothetical protein [Nocardioides alcanivorans]